MASRRYTVESNSYEIDGKVFYSVYEAEQKTKEYHGLLHEEVYNAETDEWEDTTSIKF